MARNTIDQDINIIAHADNTIVKTINQKHIVGAVPKSNHKIVERGENQHPLIATSI
jgi:hypothetical protein